MLLYFKTKTCIQIEHSNIKLIFITYLSSTIAPIPTELPLVSCQKMHIILHPIYYIWRMPVVLECACHITIPFALPFATYQCLASLNGKDDIRIYIWVYVFAISR